MSDSPSDGASDAAARAWGWVAHLRAGGSTSWSAWHGADGPVGRVLPGAQQLELLRRVNASAQEPGRLPRGLADRILAASAAGRGRSDLPLSGAGEPAYGPRPVDPGELGAADLVRVASVLLAEDAVALWEAEPAAPRTRRWRRRYRLLGDPLVAAQARAALVADGRPEGGPKPVFVVVAGPFDDLLAHTWTQRCFEHGTRSWPQWLRFWRERDQLPPRLDPVAAVRRWRVDPQLVRVVTDRPRLAGEVGVRRLPATRIPGADQAELARRIAAVTGLLTPAHQRPAVMAPLAARLPAAGLAPVAVPDEHRDWVQDMAARVTRELRHAGYPVVGDITDLTPRFGAEASPGGAELEGRVLDLAIGMLVDPGWRTGEGRPEEGQGTR